MTRLKQGLTYIGLGALLVVAGCEASTQLVETEPPVVTVSQPIVKEIADYYVFTGRIEATETVEVRARVRGELIGVHFTDGAIVEKGDLLFEIDPRTYKAALDVAVAKKASAEANLKMAVAEYERSYELYKDNAVSAREVEAWISKRGTAAAEVAASQAEIDRAKLDLEFTKIKAPITGKISRALVTKGNLVNAGGGDTLLTTIVSVDPINVYFDVDERSQQLYQQMRAKEVGASKDSKPPVIPVYLGLVTDGDKFPREGVVDFADNKINPATGTIRVRGVFPNKLGHLTPGQFARVKIPVGKKYQALLVTDQAIGIDQGQKYVLVVNDQKKVEYRPVTPGRVEDGLRIFPPGAGIKAGEWIIVNGVQRVRPDIEVAPEQVPMPTLPTGGKANSTKNTKA
jgi:RND family efflux transporter MFP subunit